MTTPADVAGLGATVLRRRHALALGSGTWAIALLLRVLAPPGRRGRIALPAFLCHNPLAAVLHAGWTPWFCDVDEATGVPPPAEWRRALDAGVDALLFVHLFGNPEDPGSLHDECRRRGVFLIEDACQALGARVGDLPCGSFGDASIVSFGHTKQVDAGGGSLLLSNDDELLERVRNLAHAMTAAHVTMREAQSVAYSADFYRRKAQIATLGPGALAGLAEAYQPLVPCAWACNAERARKGLEDLGVIAAERRRKADMYRDLLAGTGIAEIGMGKGSSPWRYCFRLPGIDRLRQEGLALRLRERGIEVSNWYLPTPWLLSGLPEGPGWSGTEALSASVFQFWLDGATGDDRVRASAAALRELLS